MLHQYVPLDLKPAVSRFPDHWKPDLAIIAESEIWPMTILELGTRRVPQVLVNGRLSDRSFAAWKKRSFIAEALFENLSHVVAQSELDGERFRALGARPVSVSGNLKVDTERLASFLEYLPEGTPAAFEFRHETWKDPEVYDLLRSRNMAFVCADHDESEDDEPIWGYLRLRRPADLERWAHHVTAQEWDRAFVFFKHEDEGAGPRMAAHFEAIRGAGS